MNLPEKHPSIPKAKTGVLLINLGTPDSYDYWSMRRYLSEFLSDRRVIELNPILWQPILQFIILTTRPSKSGAAYKKIWRHETNESPLRFYTRSQAEKLQTRFESDSIQVDWAMRYGSPSIPEKLKSIQDRGCKKILIFPLYAQYAAATVATIYDKAFEQLQKTRWQPVIRGVQGFHDRASYIDALARSYKSHLDSLGWKPDVSLASFHGIPQSYFEAGDPYHCFCSKTARLLREKLNLSEDQMRLCFQSRFGPKEWLQPYTDKSIVELAKNGVKNLVVITPGFFSDCLETLEEMNILNRELFLKAGGENYSVVPCLNDSENAMSLLEEITRAELSGWI